MRCLSLGKNNEKQDKEREREREREQEKNDALFFVSVNVYGVLATKLIGLFTISGFSGGGIVGLF